MTNLVSLKTLESFKFRTEIPVLETCLVKNGVAYATDLDTVLIAYDIPLADGLYNLAGLSSGAIKSALTVVDWPEVFVGDPLAFFAQEKPQKVIVTRENLEFIAHAQSFEETRYYLNGILFDKNGHLVATDGHRMTVLDHQYGNLEFDRIVPRDAIKWTLKTSKKNSDITFAIGNDRAYVLDDSGRPVIISKYIDGTFPDWRRVMPDKSNMTDAGRFDYREFETIYKRIKSLKQSDFVLAIGNDRRAQYTFGNDLDSMVTEQFAVSVLFPELTGFNVKYLAESGANGACYWLDKYSTLLVIDHCRKFVCMPARLAAIDRARAA